jgi:hypothetical protein
MDTRNGPLVIRVAEVIGEAGTDEGTRLNRLIAPALAAGGEVELDFEGVDAVTEPFLEAAVAPLLEEVPFDELLRRLIVSNMTVRDVQGLRFVLERARRDPPECPIVPLPPGRETENP